MENTTNISEISDIDLIFNVRSIIATGGIMDSTEKAMVCELINRFENASEKMERLYRYMRRNGAGL